MRLHISSLFKNNFQFASYKKTAKKPDREKVIWGEGRKKVNGAGGCGPRKSNTRCFIVSPNVVPIVMNNFFLGLNKLVAFAELQKKPITALSRKRELWNI